MAKRGRPKGQKNKIYTDQVIEIPAVCPHCSSSSVAMVRGAIARRRPHAYHNPIYGMIEATEWRNMECHECGALFVKKSLQLAQAKTV